MSADKDNVTSALASHVRNAAANFTSWSVWVVRLLVAAAFTAANKAPLKVEF